MSLFKAHPIFFGMAGLATVAGAVEGWYLYSGDRTERHLARELNQKVAEIEALQRQKPAPIERNLQRVRADFAQTTGVLTTMLKSLNVVSADELDYFKGEPTSRTEAFFDIAQFVENARANAAKAEVIIKPDERFGFSAYAQQGPEPEYIRPVYRQRRIVEYLLGALFASHPRSLAYVQREEPIAVPQTPAPGGSPAAAPEPAPLRPATTGKGRDQTGANDIFAIDPQVSARTPGYVSTIAFRIAFTGQTSALRSFINALAVPEIPLVVRSVEVEPVQSDAGKGQPGSRTGSGPTTQGAATRTGSSADVVPDQKSADMPIVADNESRFIVTIELFEVNIKHPGTVSAAAK